MSITTSAEKLLPLLERLEQNEHEQIFKIVRKYTDEYTRSDTGVYVSSKNLPQTCLDEIERYITFCFDQRAHLEAGDVDRSKYEKLAKTGKVARF
jgi:hypothetical protein